MKDGGTLFCMTYYGSQMVVENYNIMGPVKAALESGDPLPGGRAGPQGHPRPRHLARARSRPAPPPALPSSTSCWRRRRRRRRRSLVSIDDVGVATAFLATDRAKLITGETLYIDGGYHIID